LGERGGTNPPIPPLATRLESSVVYKNREKIDNYSEDRRQISRIEDSSLKTQADRHPKDVSICGL